MLLFASRRSPPFEQELIDASASSTHLRIREAVWPATAGRQEGHPSLPRARAATAARTPVPDACLPSLPSLPPTVCGAGGYGKPPPIRNILLRPPRLQNTYPKSHFYTRRTAMR